MNLIEAFFRDMDRWWQSPPGPDKIPLRIIGSAALVLRTGYDRTTKDSDVLETAALSDEIKRRLLDLAGKGTDLHRRHRLYLEIVASGLPFLPQDPLWHPLPELSGSLAHFEIAALDVVDVSGPWPTGASLITRGSSSAFARRQRCTRWTPAPTSYPATCATCTRSSAIICSCQRRRSTCLTGSDQPVYENSSSK